MAVAAPVVAAVGLCLVYGVLTARHRGPRATYWNAIRCRYLPRLDRLARRFGLGYAAYELHPRELAGTVDEPVETVESTLAGHGFERMPLAAWKTLGDGRGEAGSWALREGPLAERQLHVMLFASGDGTTELYAHEEYNAFHPRYANNHYYGVDYDPEGGQQRLEALLGDRLTPAEPVDSQPPADMKAHERAPGTGTGATLSRRSGNDTDTPEYAD